MSQGLTPKQEAFANAVALGQTYSDAYRLCYSTSKMTDKSVNELASTLMAEVKISSRVEELRREIRDRLVEKELWSREDSVKVLVAVAQRSDEGARDSDKVRSVAELNKMHGYLAPTKTEATINDVRQEVLENLTDGQKVRACIAGLRHFGGKDDVAEYGREIEEFCIDFMKTRGYDFE